MDVQVQCLQGYKRTGACAASSMWRRSKLMASTRIEIVGIGAGRNRLLGADRCRLFGAHQFWWLGADRSWWYGADRFWWLLRCRPLVARCRSILLARCQSILVAWCRSILVARCRPLVARCRSFFGSVPWLGASLVRLVDGQLRKFGHEVVGVDLGDPGGESSELVCR